jgi:hypothetical protein
MSKVTFGGEGTLKIYKRVNSEETLKLTFKDANGDPYIYPSNLFQFILKKNYGDKKNIFVLDSSSGVTLVSNELSIQIDAADSNLNEGEYYYQLTYDDKVILNGACVLYNGVVDAAN